MKELKITSVVVESHKKNYEIGRKFYRYIMDEIEKLKGGDENGTKKENQ